MVAGSVMKSKGLMLQATRKAGIAFWLQAPGGNINPKFA